MGLNLSDINDLEILAQSTNMLFAHFISSEKNSCKYTKNVKELFGYSPEEIQALPHNHYSLIVDEETDRIQKTLFDIEKDGSSKSAELIYKVKSKEGKDVWIKENINLLRNGGGAVKEKTCALMDITKLKCSENDSIKQVSALKELNANKDKFISIVSHDLRAPFTTLLGFSEILLNEQDISEEEKSEYLQYIYESSKSQLNFINCLLDWSRLQTGRVKVEQTRLNVKNTIANAIAPLTGDAVRKNIDIKIEIDTSLFMNADERLVGQSIISLVSNAIKFSPEGKTVYVIASRFKEGMIEIIVRDDGAGISEENQGKLFRIDQKLVLPGTNGEKGSGMGLTLAKEIIDKHGGDIWFYSQPNEGSEFHITLPEAKNYLLIVEDNNIVCDQLKELIISNFSNFEIKTSANGYEAIRNIRDVPPTLIITKHDLQLMDGIKFIEAINKRESGRNIPIIVFAEKITEDLKKSYSKLGVDKLLVKSSRLDVLLDTMQECLFR